MDRVITMKATIISVGNEILLGKTVNTNLSFLAASLFALGIEVHESMAIRDDEKAIHNALFKTETPLIIFTGGLGPTQDDKTKESVASYYGLTLIRNEQAYRDISEFFKRAGRTMDPSNDKQADFPENAVILKNTRGTAPGAIIPHGDKHIILLPGPPSELRPMFPDIKEYLKPYLNETVYQKGFLVVGQGESDFETKMAPVYKGHPDVNIAPYASTGEITYIFTSRDEDKLKKALDDFKWRFNTFIVGAFDTPLEEHVVSALADQNKTISFAESCTGGMVASRLVNVSGASNVFKESFILYDNESKVKHLGVNRMVLEKYGAVSDACVYELAYQLHQRTGADVSLSVSGIAGPEGGTKDKPVGLVYFGIHHEGRTKTYSRIFAGDRHMIRVKATAYALYLVHKTVMHDED